MATVILGDFEWDEHKAAESLRKHAVSFEEAITASADTDSIIAPDLTDPDRWITIGRSALLRILFVVHGETVHDRIRIISARNASAARRRIYEET